jgi:hypothetical protein
MRILACTSALAIISLGASVAAQQADSPTSVERVRRALDNSQPSRLTSAILPGGTAPDTRRLGPLTLVPPQTNGEFVRIVVPVGGLAMRAVNAVAAAQHRRAEGRAHDEVERALQNFQAPRSGK